MSDKLYIVRWHDNYGPLPFVEEITVLRRGVSAGCYLESIDAIDSEGHKFRGDPDEYFESQEDAIKDFVFDLHDSIKSVKATIESMEEQKRLLEETLHYTSKSPLEVKRHP